MLHHFVGGQHLIISIFHYNVKEYGHGEMLMNQLRLKEIYIEDGSRRKDDHSYLVCKKEDCEVHLNRREMSSFI